MALPPACGDGRSPIELALPKEMLGHVLSFLVPTECPEWTDRRELLRRGECEHRPLSPSRDLLVFAHVSRYFRAAALAFPIPVAVVIREETDCRALRATLCAWRLGHVFVAYYARPLHLGAFGACETLTIVDCLEEHTDLPAIDFEGVGSAGLVDLYHVRGADVAPLRACKKVGMNACRGLTNVSRLAQRKDQAISFTWPGHPVDASLYANCGMFYAITASVQNVGALSRCTRVFLALIDGAPDISVLGGVGFLTVKGQYGLSNPSALSACDRVELFDYPLETTAGLGPEELLICDSESLTTLGCVSERMSIEIADCPYVEDYAPLLGARRVLVRGHPSAGLRAFAALAAKDKRFKFVRYDPRAFLLHIERRDAPKKEGRPRRI